MTDADLARWEAESNADSAPGMHEELLACIAEVRRLRAYHMTFPTTKFCPKCGAQNPTFEETLTPR